MANLAKTSGRQAARGAAEGTAQNVAQAKTSGRKGPAPREESDNTTETNPTAAEAAPAKPIPLVVVAPNPKRKGSIAHGFYAKYGPTCTLTTYEAIMEAGVRGKDVSWDRDRGHILIDDEEKGILHASNFPCDGTREEQAAYLQSIDPKIFNDKVLIKWGYKDAPKEETASAEGAETKEKADA